MKFLNYETALDYVAAHPGAVIKQDGKDYIVNVCLNCNTLSADGEDWCPRCKEMVEATQAVNEAIFARGII